MGNQTATSAMPGVSGRYGTATIVIMAERFCKLGEDAVTEAVTIDDAAVCLQVVDNAATYLWAQNKAKELSRR